MNRPHVIEVEVVSPLSIVKTPSFNYKGEVKYFNVDISIDDEMLGHFEYRVEDNRILIKSSFDCFGSTYGVICALIGFDRESDTRFEQYIIDSFFDTPDDSDTYE